MERERERERQKRDEEEDDVLDVAREGSEEEDNEGQTTSNSSLANIKLLPKTIDTFKRRRTYASDNNDGNLCGNPWPRIDFRS